jgi:hypothetical protein
MSLTDIWSGGTWNSTSIAVDVSTTGAVTGLSAGTAIISYSLATGCFTTTTVAVLPVPAVDLVGSPIICSGESVAWSASIAGGVWSSNPPTVASVDAGGNIHGIAVGTATISYQLSGGCFKVKAVTVNPAPSSIIGTLSLTKGGTSTLSNSVTGGVWISSNTAIATIGAATGVVSGVTSGTAEISYALPGPCEATAIVTVDPPSGILTAGYSTHTIAVIPNPNKGTFTIQGTLDNSFEGGDVAIEVIDVLGRTVARDAAVIKDAALRKDMALSRDHATGVYFIRVHMGDNIDVVRFLLENGVPK